MNEIKKETFRKKIGRLFSAIEFRFIFFFFSLLVLSGPLIVFSKGRTLHFPFVYYFLSWLIIIAIIAIINIFSEDDTKKNI